MILTPCKIRKALGPRPLYKNLSTLTPFLSPVIWATGSAFSETFLRVSMFVFRGQLRCCLQEGLTQTNV